MRHESALESGLRALELAQRSNNIQAEVRARIAVTISLTATGDRDGARLHATANLEIAESLRDREHLWTTPWLLGQLSRLEGDWQAAHRFLDRALGENPDVRWPMVNKALAHYEVGETKEGDTWIKQLATAARDEPGVDPRGASVALAWAMPLISRITGTAGDLDTVEGTALAALATLEGRPFMMINARITLALLAVHRSDTEAAAEHYQALRSRPRVIGFIASDRLLGLLAYTMGKLDDAASHFEDAVDFCRKAGYRPELAWSLCDYADTLHERGGDGDRERAVSLLDESLAISRDLGMRPLMERVLSRREHLKA